MKIVVEHELQVVEILAEAVVKKFWLPPRGQRREFHTLNESIL
jgi:hypothetical protein